MPRLRIGLIAPPWVPVPPPLYGGTELAVDVLARGLAARGHEVRLFTTGDSTCAVPRGWIYRRALGITNSAAAERRHVQAAYRSFAGEVDIIHDHTLTGPYEPCAERAGVPVVTTVHGPFSDELVARIRQAGDRVAVIAISRAHAASAPGLRTLHVVYHGLDVDASPLGDGDGGYVAFLGRMSPDKGADRAILAARRAGVPIRLAAKMWEPEERAFFAEAVEPLLGSDARYVGELGPRDKAEFLGGAVALLNPISWPEPFGLVMVEAMACGTPVVSFRAGSAPEIVDPGVNGFLCDDVAGMASAIPAASRLDRSLCKARASARFSDHRMVDDHLRLYRALVTEWRWEETA